MQKYPHMRPSLPILRTGVQKTTAAALRTTTVFELPAIVDSSLPYLPPPAVRFSSKTATLRKASNKDRRDGFDFELDLTLAQKRFLDNVTAGGRRNSFLPSIHTQGPEDAQVDWNPSRTPSSTYSSSIYTSEFDFEFPQPPVSPDIGAYKDFPIFTEDETSQVRNFLRKRWGAIDTIDQTKQTTSRITTKKPPVSVPVSAVGNEMVNDPRWTGYWDTNELGDFSWEASDGSAESTDNKGTHNMLGQMGFLHNIKNDGREFSPRQTYEFGPMSKIPVSTFKPNIPAKDDLDDVSVVLSALRSSINLDDFGEREKCLDDGADHDNDLREEVRIRLKTKGFMAASYKRDKPVVRIPSPGVVTSKLPQGKNILSNGEVFSPNTPSQKPPPTQKVRGDFGEVRISVPRHHGARHTVNANTPLPPAFERLESSVSKLQALGCPQPRRLRSHLPPVPPKDKLDDLPLPPSKDKLKRKSGIMKGKMVANIPQIPHSDSEPQNGPQMSSGKAPLRKFGDRDFHARSPSASASVAGATSRAHLTPFSIGRPNASHSQLYEHNIPQPHPFPQAMQSNAEGFKSFIDITPEQKPRRTHNRSRSSIAGAVFHAEKARKLLARASSGIASWGKGLARSSSKKG